MSAIKSLHNNLQASIDIKQTLIEKNPLLQSFEQSVGTVYDSYRSGGWLYIAGNGVQAADAQHLVAALVSNLGHNRAALPAEALTTYSSISTAIGNDYAFEHIFLKQLIAKLKENDIFLALLSPADLKIY